MRESFVCARARARVCVCEREREREKGGERRKRLDEPGRLRDKITREGCGREREKGGGGVVIVCSVCV